MPNKRHPFPSPSLLIFEPPPPPPPPRNAYLDPPSNYMLEKCEVIHILVV